MSINEVKTVQYEVFGYKFDNIQEAVDFESGNVFTWDDYDECYLALDIKDVSRYSLMFKEEYKNICKTYKDLANSNSMGALYPLAVIKYVFETNNCHVSSVWECD